MSLNDKIDALETKLTNVLFDAKINIKEIYTGDIGRGTHNFPAIHILKTSATKSDQQVMSGRYTGLIISYDVTCLFSGSEGQHTIKNASAFVNDVYDTIQNERISTKLLDGLVINIDCTDIAYGLTEFDGVMVYGGLITLEIEIINILGE